MRETAEIQRFFAQEETAAKPAAATENTSGPDLWKRTERTEGAVSGLPTDDRFRGRNSQCEGSQRNASHEADRIDQSGDEEPRKRSRNRQASGDGARGCHTAILSRIPATPDGTGRQARDQGDAAARPPALTGYRPAGTLRVAGSRLPERLVPSGARWIGAVIHRTGA